MEITKEQDQRMVKSRQLLQKAWNVAFGSYIEQEATKGDSWRDHTIWQQVQHLRHELDEIERSKSATAQLHNAIDAVSLSTMLLATLLEREKP